MIIKVRAGKDKIMHFPQGVIAGPGATTMHISGDTEISVDDKHRFIRRRLKVGDLVLVKTTKTARKTAKKE